MTNDRTPPSATPEWRDHDEGADAAADRTYNPSMQQVNRSREQGLGVGQTEINAQRDPTRYDSAERYGAGEGGPQDLSPEGGGVSTPTSAFSDSGESLDDARDQLESGDQS
jgi:hypothetical protein